MKKLLIVTTLLLSIAQGFAQTDSIEVAQTEAKGILKELFMFKMAIDVLETRQLISDNELGDSVKNYMTDYDNALFFKSSLDYKFFWNSVLERKNHKVPSRKLFLDSKEKYIDNYFENNKKNPPSIDFDVVLTPQWEDPVKEDKVKDYKVEITTGNYTNLDFIEYDERTLLDEAMNSLLTNVATPKEAKVNEAVFEGLAELRDLCENLKRDESEINKGEVALAIVILEGEKTEEDFKSLNLTRNNWKGKEKVFFLECYSQEIVDGHFENETPINAIDETIPYWGDNKKFTAFSVKIKKDGTFVLINTVWENHDSEYPSQKKFSVLNNESNLIRLNVTKSTTSGNTTTTKTLALDCNIELKKGVPFIYYEASNGYIRFGEETSIFGKDKVKLIASLEVGGNTSVTELEKEPDVTICKKNIDKIYLNEEEFTNNWREFNLNSTSINNFKIIPELGDDFTIKINSKESEFVSVIRPNNNYDGSYSVENYNDYDDFDGDNIAKNNSNYATLETNSTYLLPRIVMSNQTSSIIELSVVSENGVINKGIHEYTFKTSDSESFTKTFLSYTNDQHAGKIEIKKEEINREFISIFDGNNNLKGKIQVFDKRAPISNIEVQPVIIEYKGHTGNSINLTELNETFGQAQINVRLGNEQRIAITESIIRSINFGQYSCDNVISFLNNLDVSSDVRKFVYIFNKIHSNFLKNQINSNNHIMLSVPFTGGNIGGYAHPEGENIFCLTFNSQNQPYTPSHELLHLFGLKDLMVELNYCTNDQLWNGTCSPQNKISNIMSYSSNNCGLWIWQINIMDR